MGNGSEANFHRPALLLLLDQQAVGGKWERVELPREGKCMCIKKWILAQIEALNYKRACLFQIRAIIILLKIREQHNHMKDLKDVGCSSNSKSEHNTSTTAAWKGLITSVDPNV